MKNKILCFLIAMGFANSLYAASILDIDFPQSGEEIVLTDSEVNNFSLTKHGFTPKGTSTAGKYLRGDGFWTSPVSDMSAYILINAGTGTGNIFTGATLAGASKIQSTGTVSSYFTGNVSIGTSTPQTALHVAGTATFTNGNIGI